MVEEGAKVSQIIMWLLYLCVKPETSEINVAKAFPCHCKSTNISRVSCVFFLWELWAARSLLGSVKKI